MRKNRMFGVRVKVLDYPHKADHSHLTTFCIELGQE